MPSSLYARCIGMAICLALVACTGSSKTQTDTARDNTSIALAASSPMLGLGANMVAIVNPLQSDEEATVSDELRLQDPVTEAGAITAGIDIDRKRQLPCQWVSEDAQFSLEVSNAANIATRSRLSIQLTATTYHDTEILLSRIADAVDSAGKTLMHTDHTIDGSSTSLIKEIKAGTPTMVTLNFNDKADAQTLTTWTVEFLDSGVLRKATFDNIPVGTIATHQADCQYTLPCIWTTPQNDVAITLHTIGVESSTNALAADFSILTSENVSVAIDDGTVAIGSDTTSFESRSHTLASQQDYRQISALAQAYVPVHGSVVFYRTENVPATLEVFTLPVFKDLPVPQWNPRFINVPVQ